MPSSFWPKLVLRIVGTSLVAGAVAATAWGAEKDDEFPYSARVVGEDVYVRSGPGSDYYPTAKLQPGDVLEVYRRDPGGWLAVRPPRHSFCLVAISKLKPLGDSVAVAKENKVEVHVGSALGDMRDVIQVRLDRDEPVEVIEEPERDKSDAWVKISPPPGEFRWIASRFVERVSRAQAREANRPTPTRWTELAASGVGGDGGSWSQRGARGSNAGGGGSREIEQLNHELSARVVQDLSQWQFDDLKQRSQRVHDTATNDQDRADAQQMLDKIGRFESIRIRREAFNRPASQLASGAGGGPPVAIAPRYDGAGRLTPVVSSKPGAPLYALVDPNGAVVQYVTPAPGVNLQSYVNHQVGVSGPRTFMPDYQRQQISAQRITLLDDGTRRY